MGSNIITLDISKLDNEIYAIEAQIAELNAKKAMKIELREYIKKNAISNQQEPVKHPENAFYENMGISDFIVTYLKYYKDSDTKSIISAYCHLKNKKYDEVANNVSNALSRLKTAGELRSEEQEGGRRAGLIWNLK